MSETFHIGDLLTVTTGRLVSPTHMDGLYQLVDYMTGVPHFTHQLPRAAEACKPHLLKQHPWLAQITVPDGVTGKKAVRVFLDTVAADFGEHHEVAPIPDGEYMPREPLSELAEMVGHDRVIPVVVDDR